MNTLKTSCLILCLLLSTQSFAHNQLTVTGVDPDAFFSAYGESLGQPHQLFVVPNDKTFVLTDVVPTGSGSLTIGSGGVIVNFSNNAIIHFVTGLKIGPSKEVLLQGVSGTSVTISGYLY